MRTLLFLAILAAAAGCGTTDTSQFSNVQVSFATQRPTPSLHAVANDTIMEGGNTLVITRAEVVLREIELKRVETVDCEGSDACEKFETGPVLVDLPLGPGAVQAFALDIPPGSYDEIEFDVHKPDDGDPADQAFVMAHPDFATISIRVQGTYNGQAFTYVTDLDVQQELALTPALEIVNGSGAVNVTILVDLRTWFRNETGTLIDPAQANKDGPFESVVRNRIQNSFQAYKDQNRDGGSDN